MEKEAKEASKEQTLNEISANIQGIEAPLLPASIILTLEVPRKNNDAFNKLPSLHDTDNFSMLLGLNPNSNEPYRMQIPDGFVDVEKGEVTTAGVYRTEPPILNTVEEKATHTYIRFNPEKLTKAIESGMIHSDDLCWPASIDVKVKTTRYSEPISLKANLRTAEPLRLVVFDEVFYVSFLVKDTESEYGLENPVAVTDLMNCNISLKLSYMTLGMISKFTARIYCRHSWLIFR